MSEPNNLPENIYKIKVGDTVVYCPTTDTLSSPRLMTVDKIHGHIAECITFRRGILIRNSFLMSTLQRWVIAE